MTPDDRLLAVTTIGFDIAALELYLPLLGGASVVADVAGDRAGCAGAGEDDRRERRHRHAGDADAVADAAGRRRRRLPDLEGLAMLTGGEALPGELARDAGSGMAAALDQSVRPDRDHDLVRRMALDRDELSDDRREPADRSSDLEHAGVCSGRRS